MRLCSLLGVGLFASLFSQAQTTRYTSIGKVVRIDSRINQLLSADARIDIIASGFSHLEGPFG